MSVRANVIEENWDDDCGGPSFFDTDFYVRTENLPIIRNPPHGLTRGERKAFRRREGERHQRLRREAEADAAAEDAEVVAAEAVAKAAVAKAEAAERRAVEAAATLAGLQIEARRLRIIADSSSATARGIAVSLDAKRRNK
ncbi:uncharacterized protein LOC126265045 [Aethina tumida]|uniref:uncharacterized protein LOC126265045 n=1 Tax=Aethina tumida TaxID=116153 RepID=UPI00214754FF|nr:uncharacterized protein LOC126265045 [Aethina tumida]